MNDINKSNYKVELQSNIKDICDQLLKDKNIKISIVTIPGGEYTELTREDKEIDRALNKLILAGGNSG